MINKVILVGHVGKDPEVKHLENGTAFARFTLATSESYKDKDGNKQTNTEWHNIVVWRGLADVAEKYVKKGNKLYIEGKISSRSYEKDGVTKYFYEIVGNTMQMLDSKPSTTNTSSATNEPIVPKESETKNNNTEDEKNADDLPF